MALREELERLVDNMVAKGVRYDDAAAGVRKAFHRTRPGGNRRQPREGCGPPGHAPQHPEPQGHRVSAAPFRVRPTTVRPVP